MLEATDVPEIGLWLLHQITHLLRHHAGPESSLPQNPPAPAAHRREQEEMQAGFRRFQDAGVQGRVVPGYISSRWWDDDAIGWARHQIPFDEVADWIGAGLTATEVVEQRAAGITVEQVAALRALRNSGTG